MVTRPLMSLHRRRSHVVITPTMKAHIDHLVLAAPTLDKGVEYVEKLFGVKLPREQGCAHEGKGTHNVVVSLGDDVYLEILALDPNAKERNDPRWTWLDNKPNDFQPTLETWAVRCKDVRAALEETDIKPGKVVEMQRGDMKWLITIADDGSLKPAADGAFPFMIQWENDSPHPVGSKLKDSGLHLKTLQVRSLDYQDIISCLHGIGLHDHRLRVSLGEGPRLVATITTPDGERTLETHH
ncbi:hypothetical protein A1Q1_03063 [Trichosporon asahii var. asahii CBS 2479]|uniref:Glyoxalase-like domain-containing protein n=1 Tax=Trichosporon asahii var. asahii (strain ATCC 90039 / CBS 2479 / JCM 2466 / KCTC 7840 / NBRC 103889/ NCYC 2677 / UAMH 7654) TaxID=1186058 RepID=J6F6D1_TRIAS|nr:hypothetical protein A1Q1_03063 [Trichosporon asahii var. asahii CBS 2479]EJT52609.1 hypothetical protein A1Q1_03063 [Trichosporon asahii var. asahii CBS 2479]